MYPTRVSRSGGGGQITVTFSEKGADSINIKGIWKDVMRKKLLYY